MTSIWPQDTAPPVDPARGLGIVGLIFSVSGVFCGLVGLVGAIISTIAFVRSRRAGLLNRYALAGIIIGLLFLALGFVLPTFFPLPGRPS
jgi:hypothetical protein